MVLVSGTVILSLILQGCTFEMLCVKVLSLA